MSKRRPYRKDREREARLQGDRTYRKKPKEAIKFPIGRIDMFPWAYETTDGAFRMQVRRLSRALTDYLNDKGD